MVCKGWNRHCPQEMSWVGNEKNLKQSNVREANLKRWSEFFFFFFLTQEETLHIIIVVLSLSRVWLFATPWTATRQVSLSFTISQSVLKLMSIKSVMPSSHLILCRPLFLLLSIFPSIRVFFNELTFSSDGESIRWPMSQLQHQSFQWIFRVFFFSSSGLTG